MAALLLILSSAFIVAHGEGYQCRSFTDVVAPSVGQLLTGPQWYTNMAGVWYEVAGADATQPKWCTCSQYNVSLGEDGNPVHSNNRFSSKCPFNVPLSFKGHFDTDVPGKYFEAFGYDTTTPNTIIDYGVFAGTSNTYAILYSCNPMIHFYAIQLLARSREVASGAIDTVLQALGNRTGLDVSRVTYVPQTDCTEKQAETPMVLV